ncbi:MAG: hypothetical protein NW223_19340 [Hyphomicrobiaceae bacterium]|nr:hypothetical protein [Hyphomicrobiaceae bacterium]
MDVRKLGNILMVLGAVVAAAACAWWYAFYSAIVREVTSVPGGTGQISVMDAKSCLFSSSDFCGLISGAARMLGKTPYEPMLLWLGAATLVIGAVVRVSAKPSSAK